MTNHNRKDELADHFECFSQKQIARLPETLNRQISRAKNMIYFGGKRMRELRERNPFMDLRLDTAAMELIYEEIQAEEFVRAREWKPLYVRYLLEYHWLATVLQEPHWTPPEIYDFANKRGAALSALEGIEKSQRIRFHNRWVSDDENHTLHKESAQHMWLDELTGTIRTSVTKELHWRSMLHNHGHGKTL